MYHGHDHCRKIWSVTRVTSNIIEWKFLPGDRTRTDAPLANAICCPVQALLPCCSSRGLSTCDALCDLPAPFLRVARSRRFPLLSLSSISEVNALFTAFVSIVARADDITSLSISGDINDVSSGSLSLLDADSHHLAWSLERHDLGKVSAAGLRMQAASGWRF